MVKASWSRERGSEEGRVASGRPEQQDPGAVAQAHKVRISIRIQQEKGSANDSTASTRPVWNLGEGTALLPRQRARVYHASSRP